MSASEDRRAEQVRRLLASAGLRALESRYNTIYGIPGVRIIATNDATLRSGGKEFFTRFIELNREMRTVVVRTRASRMPVPPRLEEAPAVISLGDLAALLAFWNEHHRDEEGWPT